MRFTIRLPYLVLFVVAQAACSSNGCSQLGKTPGGYPTNDRQPGAIQLRATDSLFTFLNANGTTLIPALLPGGSSSFSIPPTCSGNTKICCTNPATDCKLDLDFRELDLQPTAPDSIALSTNFALKTQMPLPVGVSFGISANCFAEIDTTLGARSDLTMTANLKFVVTERNTTRLVMENPSLVGLEREDITLNANGSDALCTLADTNAGKDLAIGLITMQFAAQIAGAIDGQQCAKCTAIADCNDFAASCDAGLCKDGNGQCIEQLGLEGRLDVASLLASFSPNGKGAIDIYAVAGGYAEIDTGASLGLLGGGKSAAHSPCVPQLTAPPPTAVPTSDTFRTDTAAGAPAGYHLGIGVHQSYLERALFGTFDSGGLCLAVGTITQPLLSANALKVIMPSLGDLLTENNAPLYMTTRPTGAPIVTLRRGIYMLDEATGKNVLVEPLLDLELPGFELDFYALIAERYVRIFTVRADVKLGLGLDVDADGKIVPVLGDLAGAFQNLVVSNSDLLSEPPADLAAVFPTLLNLAVGQIANALQPIALPAVGGLAVKPRLITSTDPLTEDDASPRKFLAIYADLQAAAMFTKSAETHAQVVSVLLPPREEFAIGNRGATSPSVLVALDAGGRGDLEWSYRLDEGFWSPYSSSSSLTITDARLWLTGKHAIEVRARVVGAPQTADRSPAVLEVEIAPTAGPDDGAGAGFHGRNHEPPKSSCGGCAASGGDADLAGLLLIGAVFLAVAPRRRRSASPLVAIAVLAAAASACSEDSVTEADRLSALDVIGREHAAVGSNDSIHFAAYDQTVGDLAYARYNPKSAQAIDWLYVDGIAPNAPKDPTYKRRQGVSDPGPDVGRYPAIALTRGGTPMIAYYDATARALKFALGPFPFKTHTVSAPTGDEDIGRYSALALTVPDEKPMVAYLATGLTADNNGFRSEFRIARAKVPNPKSAADWTIEVIDEGRIPCGGRCPSGRACLAALVEGQPDPDPTTSFCTDPSSDCDPACQSGTACIAGTCRQTVEALPGDLVEGVALFASAAQLPSDGTLSLAYYDRSRGALKLATQLASGFSKQDLDGEAASADVGSFPSMAIDAAGGLHIVYVDAIDDRLLYRRVENRVPVGGVEVVDDGVRDDGLHPVGGSAALYLHQAESGAKLYAYYQDQRDLRILEASRAITDSAWTRRTVTTGDGKETYGFALRHVAIQKDRYLTHYVIDRSKSTTLGAVQVIALGK